MGRPSLNKAKIKFRSIPTPKKSTFYIESLEDGLKLYIKKQGSKDFGSCRYSINEPDRLLKKYQIGGDGYITVNAGERCYLCISGYPKTFDADNYIYITTDDRKFNVGGKLVSLFDTDHVVTDHMFYSMFKGNEFLVSIESLTFPDTLDGHSYVFMHMFYGCKKLNKLPVELPMDVITYASCRGMFCECNSLTEIPYEFIMATHIREWGCQAMFAQCKSLRKLPDYVFTAKWIEARGCDAFFSMCNSLVYPVKLPGLYIFRMGYAYMYAGCPNIRVSETQTGEYTSPFRIPEYGTIDDSSCTMNMFMATGGTFTGTPTIGKTYYFAT